MFVSNGKFRPITGYPKYRERERETAELSLFPFFNFDAKWRSVVYSTPPSPYSLYPLYSRLGGSQELSRRLRKISTTTGFEPWIAQPVAKWTGPSWFLESWKSNLKQPNELKSTEYFHGCFFIYPVILSVHFRLDLLTCFKIFFGHSVLRI